MDGTSIERPGAAKARAALAMSRGSNHRAGKLCRCKGDRGQNDGRNQLPRLQQVGYAISGTRIKRSPEGYKLINISINLHMSY